VDVNMDLANQNINDNYVHKGHDGSGVTNPKLAVTDSPDMHRKKAIPE